jgi:hypothetical protein
VEPAGKQKKYTLKPHGDFEKVTKKWKSHLKNIGASWSDKKKIWSLSRDKLNDFEKIQKVMNNSQDSADEKTEKASDKPDKNEKKRKQKRDSPSSSSEAEEDSNSDDDESSSSDSDEEVIEFLKSKIKSLASSSHDKVISDDVDNSEDEDVVRISRRIRHIMMKMKSLEGRISDLEEENAFLHKQMASLKK